MARQRNQKKEKLGFKLSQPDRSTPDPSRETLLKLAQDRGLLQDDNADDGEEVVVGRVAESLLWSVSLTMLHFTVDFLVHHQYAMSLSWSHIAKRSLQAYPVIWLIFYTFHPHPHPSIFLPATVSSQIPPVLNQLFFFIVSIVSGCYLIYLTNEYSYLATLKQAPPIGCLWIWSVIELNLGWAASSLLACIGFLKLGGYSIR